MLATPNAMPAKKIGEIRRQILGQLIETKTESWDRKTIDPETAHEKKPNVIKTKMTNTVLRYPLAGNVSDVNVERAAKRWAA